MEVRQAIARWADAYLEWYKRYTKWAAVALFVAALAYTLFPTVIVGFSAIGLYLLTGFLPVLPMLLVMFSGVSLWTPMKHQTSPPPKKGERGKAIWHFLASMVGVIVIAGTGVLAMSTITVLFGVVFNPGRDFAFLLVWFYVCCGSIDLLSRIFGKKEQVTKEA